MTIQVEMNEIIITIIIIVVVVIIGVHIAYIHYPID